MNRTSLKISKVQQSNQDIIFYEQIQSPQNTPLNCRNRLSLSSSINLQQVQFMEKAVFLMNRSDNHLEILRRERKRKQDEKDQKTIEEIWNQRQMDLRKNCSKITLKKKRSDFETMVLIFLFLLLFLLTLSLAPNQFYNPNN